MRGYACVLGLLASAFGLRVAGQVLVALRGPGWLPSMEQWYSGLIPYPILLPIQVVILGVQARISWDLWRGHGFFTRRHPRFGIGLRWFSYAYFSAMLLRYVFTMALFPERRWLTGSIPIFFHWVLAGYLWVLARYHTSERGQTG